MISGGLSRLVLSQPGQPGGRFLLLHSFRGVGEAKVSPTLFLSRTMIYLSPSQIQTYLDCPRKWWSEKVARLPVPTRAPQAFGTVAHAVIMRHLAGQDPFEAGWEIAKSPFDGKEQGRIGPGEQDELRRLFGGWSQSKVLVPMGGQKLEEEFRIPLPTGQILGRMDQRVGTLVIDHKTARDARFVPTEKQLAEDPKMRIYGVAALRASPGASAVTLKLQYFFRIPDSEPMVVKADLTADDLRAWWKSSILPLAKETGSMKAAGLPADRWNEIEGPRKVGACEDYGGCHFKKRCFPGEDTPF